MNKCKCWHEANPAQNYGCNGRCYGTKECDPCHCGGDEAKCDFYPEKIQEAKRMGKTPEEIKKGLEACAGDRCDCCPYRSFAGDCVEFLCMNALSLVKQLEVQITKWISIKDRTPEDGQKVIFINDKYPSITMQGIYHADKTPDTIRVLGFGLGNVTHWMPMPEPPNA